MLKTSSKALMRRAPNPPTCLRKSIDLTGIKRSSIPSQSSFDPKRTSAPLSI